MAIAYVRDTGAQSGSDIDTDAASFASLPASGNSVFVLASMYSDTTAFTAGNVTDNQSGNVYGLEVVTNIDAAAIAIFGDISIGSPSGTFTLTLNPPGSSGCWVEWIGVEFSGLLNDVGDKFSTATGNNQNPTVTTATTTLADELVLGVLAVISGAAIGIDLPGGYTQLHIHQSADDTIGHLSAYKIISATGAQTFDGGTIDASRRWSIGIITYKDAGGGGAAVLEQTHYRWRNDDSGLVGPSY